uniref:60S ribosomal protein L31 n=1 Tax=Papio anubis TaxID=9555 RepID=A0A8I5N021_PAPAN
MNSSQRSQDFLARRAPRTRHCQGTARAIASECAKFKLHMWLSTLGLTGSKKKVHSTMNEVVTQEHIIDIHRGTWGVNFKKHAPPELREIWKFAMKEVRTPDVPISIRLHKAVWPKRSRNVPYHIHMQLSTKK